MDDEKMNLVLLNLTVDGGISGVNRYIESIRKEISHRTDIVVHSVFLVEKSSMLFSQIENKDGAVDIRIPMPVNTGRIIREDYWMTKFCEVVLTIVESHFKDRHHLVWNTDCINLSRLAVMLKARLGGQILAYLHCVPWKFDLAGNLPLFVKRYQKYLDRDFEDFNDNPVETLTYQTADKIVCVTESARAYLTSCMNVERERIHIVYNGIDDVCGKRIPRRSARKAEILYVGRISREKGIFELLNALRILYDRGCTPRLLIAGSGHPTLIGKIRKEYNMLDLDFLGKIPFDQLQKHYSACTMGVIPSLHEQCSYVAIEMAMFGLPMVVSDVDGLGEMFLHEENALKVPLIFQTDRGVYIEPENFADILWKLLNDHALRNSLSRNVRALYLEKYTSGIMLDNTVAVYNLMQH